jgi:UDP-N-acetylglucosamine--N-acetylmuramyl-(pentapeptide) pyrophosphoryl-undecaprenol N-acetylglucosamine transferase
VLVTSGSRGDEFFAAHVPELLVRLKTKGVRLDVLHQTSSAELERVRGIYAELGVSASVTPRLGSLADAYAWSTFAITRAGACTLAELALAGLPALLVPLADAAADHQATNAQRFADGGAAIWVREAEWNADQLADRLSGVLLDEKRWREMAESAQRLARPEAAADVVRDCEEVMTGRW